MLNTNTMTENITMSIVVIHYYCHFYCRTLLLLPDHHVAFSPTINMSTLPSSCLSCYSTLDPECCVSLADLLLIST